MNFDKKYNEIIEGLKPISHSPILQTISKVLGKPREWDSALTRFARGEMPVTYGKAGVETKGKLEPEYSDEEKELLLILKKLKLNPNDKFLQKRAEELRTKLLKK
jgi:hypothetical protein